MKSVDLVASQGTGSEIEAEIKERGELLAGMVGWLYPSIVYAEIERLQNVHVQKTGNKILERNLS